MTRWPKSLIPCYSLLESLLGTDELKAGYENFTWLSFTRKSFVDIQTCNIANYSDIGKCHSSVVYCILAVSAASAFCLQLALPI
jgi:hypothetical protein